MGRKIEKETWRSTRSETVEKESSFAILAHRRSVAITDTSQNTIDSIQWKLISHLHSLIFMDIKFLTHVNPQDMSMMARSRGRD